jgi:ATP-dependent Clp protease ATP-binding subunit ClpA
MEEKNELGFTFASFRKKAGDFAVASKDAITQRISNIQQQQLQQKSEAGDDHLARWKQTINSNVDMANGKTAIPEAVSNKNVDPSHPPFLQNHTKENKINVQEFDTDTRDNIRKEKDNKTQLDPNAPAPRLLDKKKVKGLSESLKTRVFGQDSTVNEVVDILKVAALNIKINGKKPAGCYLFAGPSGVGKTELAQSISDQLGVPLLKLNMGEYGLEHEVSKLIGAPPGYAGCKEDGALTGFVKENKACVILLDEIEKADPAVDKILLSIMDHGECGTNNGEIVSFTETIVIATSNLGAEVEYYTDMTTEQKNELRMGFIKEGLRPEIINRYDSIFHFNSLTPEIYGKVVNKFLIKLTDSIKTEHNFELKYSPKLIDWIVEKSYDPAMGGRPARKFIEKIVIKPLADYMLDDDFENAAKEHKEITMDLNKDENVCFKGKNRKILGVLANTKELVTKVEDGKFSKKPKP